MLNPLGLSGEPCSALRSPMHRAAMILRNPFASLLLLLSDMCRSGTAKAEVCQRRLAMLLGVSDKSRVWGGEALWAKKKESISSLTLIPKP